jgi:hypothetical protein
MNRRIFLGFRLERLLRCRVLAKHAIQPVLWTAISIASVSACAADNMYDQITLADQPVGFWDISAMDTNEPDLTGNGNNGTYINGSPGIVSMSNGDIAADFDGSSQYPLRLIGSKPACVLRR